MKTECLDPHPTMALIQDGKRQMSLKSNILTYD